MIKSLYHSRLFAILCTLLLSVPAIADDWLDAADFGLRELPAGTDATPVFRAAMEACIKQKATGLKIPAGVWHLCPYYAFEQNLAVANNDPGIKRVVFPIDGFNGFTLSAPGAHFVCHGSMIPISAENSTNVTLKGFSIDWERPFSLQAEVVAIHPELNAFDLKLHPEVCYEMRGSRFIFLEKASPSPNSWKEWAPPVTDALAWQRNLQWNMWFQKGSRHPVANEGLYALEPDSRVEELSPHLIRIFDSTKVMPEPGMILIVKGLLSPKRTSPAIRISGCKDLLLEDVTIHHAGGMGLIGQRSENITLRRFHVSLPLGKDRYVTTTADATHFNGCRGEILIENSSFENMLDDATNVHGCFVRVEKVVGNTLTCQRVHSMQRGLIIAGAGDEIRFVTSADLQGYGDAKVVSVRDLNSDRFEMTVNHLPEGGIRPNSGLYNLSWQAGLTMRDCVVRNNRARTILIATSGKVLVENNVFEHSSMAGIQMEGDNGFWWESGPTRDALIRKNLFRNMGGPVLRMSAEVDAKQFPNAVYHGGIVFEDNTIETYHGKIIEGQAIDGLIVRNNTIRMTDFAEPEQPALASFAFNSGRRIVIENNRFEGSENVRVLDVYAGTPTAKPEMKGNQGVELKSSPITK